MTQFDPASPRALLHIISMGDWAKATELGELTDSSLEAEGFIHCSYPDQVLVPANARFAGQPDLLLLVIDPKRLGSPVVVEDSYGSGTKFPHVYGPIELAAVTRSVPFPVNEEGQFSIPADL